MVLKQHEWKNNIKKFLLLAMKIVQLIFLEKIPLYHPLTWIAIHKNKCEITFKFNNTIYVYVKMYVYKIELQEKRKNVIKFSGWWWWGVTTEELNCNYFTIYSSSSFSLPSYIREINCFESNTTMSFHDIFGALRNKCLQVVKDTFDCFFTTHISIKELYCITMYAILLLELHMWIFPSPLLLLDNIFPINLLHVQLGLLTWHQHCIFIVIYFSYSLKCLITHHG